MDGSSETIGRTIEGAVFFCLVNRLESSGSMEAADDVV